MFIDKYASYFTRLDIGGISKARRVPAYKPGKHWLTGFFIEISNRFFQVSSEVRLKTELFTKAR